MPDGNRATLCARPLDMNAGGRPAMPDALNLYAQSSNALTWRAHASYSSQTRTLRFGSSSEKIGRG